MAAASSAAARAFTGASMAPPGHLLEALATRSMQSKARTTCNGGALVADVANCTPDAHSKG